MSVMAFAVALILSIMNVQAVFNLPPLPYATNSLEPVIGAQAQMFHHRVHFATYVSNLNRALTNYSSLAQLSLTSLVSQVGSGSLPRDIETTVRNNGGGAWNHAMWFSTLAPPNSTNTSTSQISENLRRAIWANFGTITVMLQMLSDRAKTRFGSGWSFVTVTRGTPGIPGPMYVVSTGNQDNPMMKLPGLVVQTIPILGFDVWEHSYYLGYGPRKAAFVEALPSIINWAQVSKNYDDAVANKPGNIVGSMDVPT